MAHIGIDLGTSNTLVARVTEGGVPEVLEIDGATVVPSVIAFEEDGLVHFGQVAYDNWANPNHDPANTFRRWKLQMGDGTVLGTLHPAGTNGNPVEITPEHLTTLFAEKLIEEIGEGLGATEVESVLVTVPHGWRRLTPEKCRATREAIARSRPAGTSVRVQEFTLSEPVAAAAYYIWEHERATDPAAREALTGQHLLVCDVGGGTFDLSFIRLGRPGSPIEVIYGVNNEYAGDYSDALLCAWVGQIFDHDGQDSYPTRPEDVLADIVSPQPRWPFLREWFGKVRASKHRLCNASRSAIDQARVKSVPDNYTGFHDEHFRVALGLSELEEALDPFYKNGRTLLRRFLGESRGVRPWAVIFCGGGSQVVGLRESIVAPVLAEAYGEDETRQILDRIKLPRRVDHSIALGAALVANGLVQVQEHIQHDVGLVFEIADPEMARELGLPPGESAALLTPILERGSPLPCSASNHAGDLGAITFVIPPGETVNVQLVVQDDAQDPWLQPFVIRSPSGGHRQSLTWSVEADRDGVIVIRLRTEAGGQAELLAQLERRPGHRLGDAGRVPGAILRPIRPEQVIAALERLSLRGGR